MSENFIQCTTCHMFASLEQPPHGPYLCGKCAHIVSLEAHIRVLEERIATLHDIQTLEREMDRTVQAVHGSNNGAGVESEEDTPGSSWVTVRRGSRNQRKRQASSELVHPNRFARLSEDVGDISSGVAMSERAVLPNNPVNSPPGTGEGHTSLGPRQMLVIGDSIIRKADRVICHPDPLNRTVCCLPGARVRHIVERIDKLLEGAGSDPAVMVHIGTNDRVSRRWSVLKNDFRELGSKLKAKTSKVVFSEILPVPCANHVRQKELRAVNSWLKIWCKNEGFDFLEHWADFAVGYNLYSKDGLHLNNMGAGVLGERMLEHLETLLN